MRPDLIAFVVAAIGCQPSATRPPGSTYQAPAFEIHRVKPGIYHAIRTGTLVAFSNAVIIEGDRDLLVVDTHVSPAAAWALRDEIRAVTSKPIRYVVNTHFHFDHVHGNEVYGPDVEIIGHEITRQLVVAGKTIDSRAYRHFVEAEPTATIHALEGRLAKEADPRVRAQLERDLAIERNFVAGARAVKPTPPSLTLADGITLWRGGLEIRIRYLGRGHTAGDLVVYLPKERIVITGDLLVEHTSYLGDAYFTDWIETLERLKQLDFDTVLPGHGRAFRGKDKLDHWQAYLRDFWDQARRFHADGVPPHDAAARVDLRAHATHYPGIEAVGISPDHGMLRAYEILDGKVR